MTLRQRAEEQHRANYAVNPDKCSPEMTEQLLYELRVHQIELEMQNDELRITQQQLDKIRARYFDLFDLAPVGYLTLDESARILEANLAAATMLGLHRKNLIRRPLSKYIFPKDQDIYFLHRRKIFETGEPQVWEMRLLDADNIPFWARLQGTPTSNSEYWIAFSNITELKLMQIALIKSEALYHSMVEISQDLVWQCDADGRYTYLNPAWEHLFGYEIHEMLGKKFSDFQLPETSVHDHREHARLMEGNSVIGYESTHIGKSGNEIHLVFNAHFIRDDDGSIIGTSGTAYDITERKKLLDAEIAANKTMSCLLHTIAHEYTAPFGIAAAATDVVDRNLDRISSAFQENLSALRTMKLTKRERQVLIMVAQGVSSKNIAGQMRVCLKTIEMHRSNLMKKLGTPNAASLARWAVIAEYMSQKESTPKKESNHKLAPAIQLFT